MLQSPVALPQDALGSGYPQAAAEMAKGSPSHNNPGSEGKSCQSSQASGKSPKKLYNNRTAMLELSPNRKMIRTRTAMPTGPPLQPDRSRTAMLCIDSGNHGIIGGGDMAMVQEENQLGQGGVSPQQHQHRRSRTAMLVATDGSPHTGGRLANSRTAMVLGDGLPDAENGSMMGSSFVTVLDMMQRGLMGLIRRH